MEIVFNTIVGQIQYQEDKLSSQMMQIQEE